MAVEKRVFALKDEGIIGPVHSAQGPRGVVSIPAHFQGGGTVEHAGRPFQICDISFVEIILKRTANMLQRQAVL